MKLDLLSLGVGPGPRRTGLAMQVDSVPYEAAQRPRVRFHSLAAPLSIPPKAMCIGQAQTPVGFVEAPPVMEYRRTSHTAGKMICDPTGL